ncbi:hypothetical protein BV20DRAFT_947973, partial [Pilatotrama ljubarskyi]
PSWLSSVPKDFGDAAGTLKADEWRILCTVYLPLALISLWDMGASYAATKDPTFLLEVLDNTMALSEMTMLNSYLRASKLRRWFQRSDCPPALSQVKRLFDKVFGNGNFAGASEAPEILEEESAKQPLSLPDDLQRCL